MSDSRNERVALVTGSSRGLGRATAVRLAALGHPVAVHYVRSEAPAAEVVDQIQQAGGRAAAFGADVADAAACDRLLREATEALGPIAVLVNNAGITADTLAMRMKDDAWQSVLDTNLTGAFRLSRGVLRGMLKARWGRIVNLSSVVARMGNAGQANYVASKAGLIGLTKALAREVSGRGVTVNAVAPGFIASDMTDALTPELKERYLEQIPAGRFGTPDDVAAMVAFLTGDEAAYVTGQTLSVDGGMTMQ
ncbi:MAG: 3-oxoacyl-[acyl-carrier-protein] reductase [Trueperaceae bacterium]